MKNLVIVESPAKAKTINNYLGSGYKVTASFGHVRDLPKTKMGIDTDKNYEPSYKVLPKSRKVIKQLKSLAKNSDTIYLATDLDREGEAISWHIMQALSSSKSKEKPRFKRIVFSEITKGAINSAIKKPREIDMDLVDAQQARRIIDRLVGYNLSPLLWKKIMRGLSAGRVQSVAVRLVVDREREIEAFKPDEYWTIEAVFNKDDKEFEAKLISEDGKRISKLDIKSEDQAQEITKILEKGEYKVDSVDIKDEKRNPRSPFTTSTLQQDAANKLGYSAKFTMKLAQSLYEAGHITYMRTDSVNLSNDAIKSIRKYIESSFGTKYLPKSPRKYKSKAKLTQEAHEAIRPTKASLTPESLQGFDAKAKKLYDLIWRRTVASQMSQAVLGITEVNIANQKYGFLSRGQMLKFDGFLKMYPDKVDTQEMPNLEVNEILNLIDLKKEQHFTKPPARYSEATLIKALEEKGIGRPSTYAPTISTIQSRGYVEKEKGRLKPLKIGITVNDLLVENFPKIVDYEFTAGIEEDLDKIASGERQWKKVVDEFYKPFEENLEKKSETIKKRDLDEKLDEKCPDCGEQLVIKYSRNGKFIGCTGFPDCKYTRPYISEKQQAIIDKANEQIKDKKCPECNSELRVVNGRYGPFIGCSNYPKCKHMEKINKKSKAKGEKSGASK